jgi:hypothetical protein
VKCGAAPRPNIAADRRSLCYMPGMQHRNFLFCVTALIVALLTMLLIDKYRQCKELGYSDCPRKARFIYSGHRKPPSQ